MINKIYLLGFFLMTIGLKAQFSTSSPYSFYGLGQQKQQNSVENRMMGNISAMADSVRINLANPATYASLKFTTFAVGATQNYNNISNTETTVNTRTTSIDYIAVALPINNFGVGFGIMPYTAVGYQVFNNNSANNTFNFYEGNGGVNKTYFSTAYNINQKWSVGLEANYYFGDIETKNSVFFQDVLVGTRETNKSQVNGFGLNFGLNYKTKISKDYYANAYGTYAPQGFFDLKNSRNLDLVIAGATEETPVSEPVELNLDANRINLPSSLMFGGGIGKINKWFVATDLSLTQSSNFGNRFNEISNVAYQNATRISLGGQYTPNYNSFANYFSRVTYRAGMRYENTGLVFDNQSVDDYGITFGLGLPLGFSINALSLGFEYGKRGTISQNLVRENYFNVMIGISFSDKWFIKSKYN